MARLILDKLSKAFPATAGRMVSAVRELSLAVEPGEFLALVGPSGCGKTTTLRLIAGLEEPDDGTLYLDEKEITRLPPRDRPVAMVFQNHALYPHMTARENLASGLVWRKVAPDEIMRRVGEMAELLGLSELLERRPEALSGGERQRVALGRALVRRPAVLLLDEPLAGLDAPLRLQLRRELVRLHRELRTAMIYVTHDQPEALALGSRVGVMNAGRLEQIGPPAELREQPATPFVAEFLRPLPVL